MTQKYDKLLDELYQNPNSSSCFTSVEPLLSEARKREPQIQRSHVIDYLQRSSTYTLHKRAYRNFKRLPTLAAGLHTDWQTDLCILNNLHKHNRGFRYLLVCIDVLSRKLYVAAVKNKTSAAIIEAFRQIFKTSGYEPWKLYSDEGTEFTANLAQQFFKRHGITHITLHTSPQFHCGIVERANRTIKERLYRYFTHHDTYKWIDVIQPIVSAINHTPCTSINNVPPADVTFQNAQHLRRWLKRKRAHPPKKVSPIKVGDHVRQAVLKDVFEKGYKANYSDELFTVVKVHSKRSPHTYRIADGRGRMVRGLYYPQDLCRVQLDPNRVWDVKIVEKATNKDGKQYFLVRWKGTHVERWIPETDLQAHK